MPSGSDCSGVRALRRSQIDKGSQPVRNILLNPQFDTPGSTVAVRTNLCAHPNLEGYGGTVAVRTNLCLNPRGVNAFAGYSGEGNQTITSNVAITGHPEGITTANRVTYTTGANPGVIILNPVVSGTKYTMSAWVWHESVMSTPGSASFAQAGVASQPGAPSTTVSTQWQRVSWTAYTASGTSQFGYRVSSNGGTGTGSFLITGVVVEASTALDSFFDGATPAQQNLVTNPSFATNTAGYSPISATLTRVTNQGGDGHVCEVSQTVAGGVRNTAIWLFGSAQAAGTYSVSFDMKGTDASFTNVRSFLYDQTSASIIGTALTTPLIKDGNYNRYTFTFTAPTTFDRVYMEAQGVAIPLGTKVWIDRVKIERGNTASPDYYEGTGDFTHGWTGTANASTSVQNATAASGFLSASTGVPFSSVISPYMGSRSAGVMTKGGNGDGGYWLDSTVVAGTAYTFSVWVKLMASVGTFSIVLRWKDAASTILSDGGGNVHSSLTIGQWTRVSWTETAPANATKLQPMLRVYSGSYTATPFYVDGCLIEARPMLSPYFDGNTAAGGDFTYLWQGTPNATVSYQQATRTGTYIGGASLPIRSTDWSASGTYSCRHISTYPAIGSAYIDLKVTGSLIPGQTYTLLVTCRVAATSVTAPDRKLAILMYGAGAHKYTMIPNAPGVYPVRLTFTLPAEGLTSYYLRLYNGGVAGDADCWWDNLLLVEGDYAGDFINPEQNLLAKWDGAAHTSTSVGYSPQFFDMAGKPTRDTINGSALASTNPAPDMGPRTAYFVYETVGGMTTSFQGSNAYGTTPTGRISLQTQNAGTDAMGVRLDFPGGESNRVTVFNGVRKSGVHVISAAVNDGLTSASICADGGSDSVISINGGTGWAGNDYTSQSTFSEAIGKRTIVFNAYHDRATRVAISRYLGNKYGANVI